MKKTIVLVLMLSALLGILFWRFSAEILGNKKVEDQNIKLTYWGFEDEQNTKPFIEDYYKTHPNIEITYVKQSLLNYRTRVQTQIRASQGPDVFRLHQSWVPMFVSDLQPAPSEIENLGEFNQTFYPPTKESLILNNQIYALPAEINGLALFYNEDILKGISSSVPKTWTEFIEIAKKATVPNQEGQIQTAGAALGTTSNVDFWPEIIALLFFQQPKGDLENPATLDGTEVLRFYTNFILDPRNKTWDTTLPTSTAMFAQGKLAFYFAPAYQIEAIKQINPSLNFKIAPVPQLPGRNISLMSFWVNGVSATSKHPKEAWELNKYLSTNHQTGKPSSRLDQTSSQINDPLLGAYIVQASYGKSWYLNSNTSDAGINEEMIVLYKEAIDGVLQGRDPLQLLQITQTGVKQVLTKYQIK